MAIKHLARGFEDDGHFDTAIQRAIYLEAVYWADRSEVVRLSQAEMASRVRVSPRLVSKEMARLCEMGRLKRLGHGRYVVKVDNNTEERGLEQCGQCGRPVPVSEASIINYKDNKGAHTVHLHQGCQEELNRAAAEEE